MTMERMGAKEWTKPNPLQDGWSLAKSKLSVCTLRFEFEASSRADMTRIEQISGTPMVEGVGRWDLEQCGALGFMGSV